MGKVQDLTGMRFGRLTVISRSNNNKHKKATWLCRCDCGKETTVSTDSLKKGATKSCGCLQKESASLQSKKNIKHGMTGTRLYNIWLVMNARCHDASHISYQYYGGRGISVCDEWRNSPLAFKSWALSSGYADNLTLDRIEVNGNYEPSNCRWVSQKTQTNNRRNNRFVSYNSETHTLAEWSVITGIRSDTLRYRLNAGWSLDKVFSSPRR